MYGYEWTGQNGIYRLSVNSKIEKEIRPVFKEELDYFGFYKHWTYPDTDAPLLWAEGIRRYILNGTCVAEAIGGGFYTKPTIKIYTDNLTLEPIDIDVLWKENERLMLGLEKTSMDFIRTIIFPLAPKYGGNSSPMCRKSSNFMTTKRSMKRKRGSTCPSSVQRRPALRSGS